MDYHYDAVGRLDKLTDESGNTAVQYTHDAAGQLVRKDLGNGVYTTYSYDAAGIAPGGELYFGDGDDSVLVSTTLEGAIKSLTVKGALIGLDGSSESFGVVAHGTIGSVKVGNITYKSPNWPALGNLLIRDGIA